MSLAPWIAPWKVVRHQGKWGILRGDGQVMPCETEELAWSTLRTIQAGRLKQLAREPGMWSITLEAIVERIEELQRRVDELERRPDATEKP
jgi:hypothetical protein